MTTLHDVQIKCPCCDKMFTSTFLGSTNFRGKRTDFHPITSGFPPLPHYIHTCPNCGYTGFESDFEDGKKVQADIAERVFRECGPLVRDGVLDGGERYELAARIAEMEEKDFLVIADRYLHAAWCCVDENNKENESTFRLLSIEYFKRTLSSDQELPIDERLTIIYLIGELYRRVGEINQAQEWFNRTISEAGEDEVNSNIKKVAIQQRDNPRDTF